MVEAVLLVEPQGSFASHASAARFHGIPLPTIPDEHVTVRSSNDRRRRKGLRCHVARGGERVVRTPHGLVSSPAQCFVELAELLGLVDLVIAGDWLVRQGKATIAGLLERASAATGPGAGLARRAAAYVRERVDSPMETRLRMLVVLAGLPEPKVNITVDVDGMPVRRYDLCWPDVQVIVEYDGRHHIERIEQWEADLERREAIDDDDWRILVVVAKGVFEHPDRTLERIHRLLRKRRLVGVPTRLRDDWRPHFPGR